MNKFCLKCGKKIPKKDNWCVECNLKNNKNAKPTIQKVPTN
jgi:NMD protein affecting ribosome stability and mRNA decay